MIPTFVNVSGGRSSGYMAHRSRGLPNHFFIFQNTGREKPETYDFLHEMDSRWSLNLIWLEYVCEKITDKPWFKIVTYGTANRSGVPFAQLIQKRRAIPNKQKRFCTIEMKIKTSRRYIRSLGYKKWNSLIGYRADGRDAQRSLYCDTMQTATAPLREAGITIREVDDFWKSQDFDLKLPIMPSGKTFGGNCMGCFWHSEYQNAHLCRNHPEQVQWLIEQEEKMGNTFNDNFSFKELSEKIKNMPELAFDEEDALCQETNGSCGI